MTKKFGLSAIALVASLCFVACDDDGSSAKSEDESSSSVVAEKSSASKTTAKSSSSVADEEEECDEDFENCEEEEDESSSSEEVSSSSEEEEDDKDDGKSSSSATSSSGEDTSDAGASSSSEATGSMCGTNSYDPSTHFCQEYGKDKRKRILALCNGEEYTESQSCINNKVMEACYLASADGSLDLILEYEASYGWTCDEGNSVSFVDSRTYSVTGISRVYTVTQFNGLFWMKENMRYAVTVDGVDNAYSSCNYYTASSSAHVLCNTSQSSTQKTINTNGLYYGYSAAQKACPDGWRLPTVAEWTSLANELDYAAWIMDDSWNSGEYDDQKSSKNTNINANGLTVPAAGFKMVSSWIQKGVAAAFWAADQSSDGLYHYYFVDKDVKTIDSGAVNSASKDDMQASVRCVKSVN